MSHWPRTPESIVTTAHQVDVACVLERVVQPDDVVVHQALVDLHLLQQRPLLHFIRKGVLVESLHRKQLSSFPVPHQLHTPIRPLS